MTDPSVPEVPGGVDAEHGYYYNLTTGQVERGMVSSWTQRIGPYATHEAAEAALETARRRTEEWDEDDRQWRSED